jgi:hypothetical protein
MNGRRRESGDTGTCTQDGPISLEARASGPLWKQVRRLRSQDHGRLTARAHHREAICHRAHGRAGCRLACGNPPNPDTALSVCCARRPGLTAEG